MVIFSRGRGSGRHRESRPGGPKDPAADTNVPAADETPGEVGRRYSVRAGGPGAAGTAEPGPGTGPYDISEAPEQTGQQLDLGGMILPVLEGVEVRMQTSAEGVIEQVVLVHRDSMLQLGAFAAPRSEGIWDEVREEIHQSLVADKVRVEEIDGPYGTELRARLRTPTGPMDVRFVGIDGPRWMVRALYQGRAAVSPEAAAALDACLHGMVVNRGSEAMPVREPIPLRLPREMAEELAAAQRQEDPGSGPGVAPKQDGALGPRGGPSHGR